MRASRRLFSFDCSASWLFAVMMSRRSPLMLLSTSSLSYPRNTCVNSVSSTAILPPGSVPRSWGLVRDVSIVRARDIRRARLPTGWSAPMRGCTAEAFSRWLGLSQTAPVVWNVCVRSRLTRHRRFVRALRLRHRGVHRRGRDDRVRHRPAHRLPRARPRVAGRPRSRARRRTPSSSPTRWQRTPASRRSRSRVPTRCSSPTAAAPTSRHGSATTPYVAVHYDAEAERAHRARSS